MNRSGQRGAIFMKEDRIADSILPGMVFQDIYEDSSTIDNGIQAVPFLIARFYPVVIDDTLLNMRRPNQRLI